VASTSSRRHDLLWPGVVLGIGLAGTLDEVILHQLLHWHHFYDRSTRDAGLVSDGIFHLVSTALVAIGVYWAMAVICVDRAGAGNGRLRRFWAGVLLGLGGFNLFDGTVQHKVLRLHQVRPAAENWLPYDVVFIGLALLVLLIGIVLLRDADRRKQAETPAT
jgi:uncharacterized membrane protein